MTHHQKTNSTIDAKQIDTITPANKHYMIFFTTTVVMLSVAIIITSFTL